MGWSARDVNEASLWELQSLFKGFMKKQEAENGGVSERPPSKADYEREKARVAALTS